MRWRSASSGGCALRLPEGGARGPSRPLFARHDRGLTRLLAATFVVVAGWAASAAPAGAGPGTGRLSGDQLAFAPVGDTVLSVDGAAYRGQVVVAPAGGGLTIVDRVGFEDYVAGIAEVPPNWPPAVLAAQAVAARTYALWDVLVHPAAAWGPGGAQICATDSCQVYAGMAKERQPGAAAWLAAVRGTSRTVLLYQNRVIEALYGSSDGGRTVSGGVPWLPSVADPEDSISPEHHWSWNEPLSALAPALGVPAGSTLVSLVSRPDAVIATIQDAAGGPPSTQALAPDAFHALINTHLPPPAGLPLALPSWRYSVSTSGTQVVVDGYGFGHGMGMSQYGALGKALRGWDGGHILAAYYGPARPVTLAPGQEPATIGVALADGVAGARISASGPFRVLDPSGRVLATGTGGGWDVAPAHGSVSATTARGSSAFSLPAPPPGVSPAQVAVQGAAPASPVVPASGMVPAAVAPPRRTDLAALGPSPGHAGRSRTGSGRAVVVGLLGLVLAGEGAAAGVLRRWA